MGWDGLWDGSHGMGDLGRRRGAPTRAVGGRVPLGLVTPALPLVLLVWGWRGQTGGLSAMGGRSPPGPPRPLGPLTLTPSAFLFSKLLAAAGGDSVSAPARGAPQVPQTPSPPSHPA